MYYLVGIFRTLSLRQHLKQPQDNYSKDVSGELGYIGVLQQRTSSLEHQKIMLKENQISQVKEFSTFLCMGRCRNLGSLKSFLWYAPHSLGPHYPLFTYGVSFPRGTLPGVTAVRWLLKVKVAQSSLTLPPRGLSTRFLCPWSSPGKNTEMGCHFLLQGIFPTQGSNPGLPHRRWILYHLSYQGNSRILEWVAYPFFRGIFPTQELNQGFLHCRHILYQLR